MESAERLGSLDHLGGGIAPPRLRLVERLLAACVLARCRRLLKERESLSGETGFRFPPPATQKTLFWVFELRMLGLDLKDVTMSQAWQQVVSSWSERETTGYEADASQA